MVFEFEMQWLFQVDFHLECRNLSSEIHFASNQIHVDEGIFRIFDSFRDFDHLHTQSSTLLTYFNFEWPWSETKKLLKSILPVLAVAEWEQPTYFEALAMAKQRNGDWGFPVGIKAAADWQNCGTPTTAQGFDAGEELECSSATCMLKCPAGQYAIGRRRIRCRWKRKHGKMPEY